MGDLKPFVKAIIMYYGNFQSIWRQISEFVKRKDSTFNMAGVGRKFLAKNV